MVFLTIPSGEGNVGDNVGDRIKSRIACVRYRRGTEATGRLHVVDARMKPMDSLSDSLQMLFDAMVLVLGRIGMCDIG